MEILEIAAGLSPTTGPEAPLRILWMGGAPQAREAGAGLLRRGGRQVVMVEDVASARRALEARAFDLAILNLDLMDARQMALCGELCAGGLTVLVAPQRSDLATRILTLEMGVASLLPPAPHPLELAARVQSIERRRAGRATMPAQTSLWRFDLSLGCLHASSGRMVRLGGQESALLRAFTHRPGRILSRQDLADLLHAQGSPADSRLIHTRVSRLRLALTPCDGAEDLIHTLRGGGYLLHATVRAAA